MVGVGICAVERFPPSPLRFPARPGTQYVVYGCHVLTLACPFRQRVRVREIRSGYRVGPAKLCTRKVAPPNAHEVVMGRQADRRWQSTHDRAGALSA